MTFTPPAFSRDESSQLPLFLIAPQPAVHGYRINFCLFGSGLYDSLGLTIDAEKRLNHSITLLCYRPLFGADIFQIVVGVRPHDFVSKERFKLQYPEHGWPARFDVKPKH